MSSKICSPSSLCITNPSVRSAAGTSSSFLVLAGAVSGLLVAGGAGLYYFYKHRKLLYSFQFKNIADDTNSEEEKISGCKQGPFELFNSSVRQNIDGDYKSIKIPFRFNTKQSVPHFLILDSVSGIPQKIHDILLQISGVSVFQTKENQNYLTVRIEDKLSLITFSPETNEVWSAFFLSQYSDNAELSSLLEQKEEEKVYPSLHDSNNFNNSSFTSPLVKQEFSRVVRYDAEKKSLYLLSKENCNLFDQPLQ